MGLPLLCPCPQEEPAHFGGLLASRRALRTGAAARLSPSSSPGGLQALLGLSQPCWGFPERAGAALVGKAAQVPEAPIGGGHRQSQALPGKNVPSQGLLQTRLSPLAAQHPSVLLGRCYAPQPSLCLHSPTATRKTSTMLKALETAELSPSAGSSSWLGGCWDTGRWARTARNAREQGLGQLLWGRMCPLSYLGPSGPCPPRKPSGSLDHSRGFSPEAL